MPADKGFEKKIIKDLDQLEEIIKNYENSKEKSEALNALEKAKKLLK